MTFQVHKIISDDIPYYFLDLQGTGTFNYTVIQNKGSNIERTLHYLNDYCRRQSPSSPKKQQSLFGISHLIEHLSFKGCKNYTTEQMSRLLKEKGYHNAETGYNHVKYYLKSISDYTNETINMVNNIAFNDMTRITDKELEVEKDIVISEANLVIENPQHVFHYNSGCKAFNMDEYDNVIGNPDTLKNITLDDLIETKKFIMMKDNLTFKIIYDSNCISPEQVIEKIENSLYNNRLSIEHKNLIVDGTYKKLLPKLEYGRNYQVENLSDYSQLLISHYFEIPDKYNIILSNFITDYLSYYSPTSLFETLREKEGLCYSINIYSGKEFEQDTYRIHTEIPKDKFEVYEKALCKSIQDTIDGSDNYFLRYYNINKMNNKINMLNLNSLNHILDELIDNPEIFKEYEDLLKTKGIITFSEQIQKEKLNYKNMLGVLTSIKDSFDKGKTVLVTN